MSRTSVNVCNVNSMLHSLWLVKGTPPGRHSSQPGGRDPAASLLATTSAQDNLTSPFYPDSPDSNGTQAEGNELANEHVVVPTSCQVVIPQMTCSDSSWCHKYKLHRRNPSGSARPAVGGGA